MECRQETFSLGKILVEKNIIQTDPIYQREGAVWGREKKQLFMDSIINGFDVPKVYLHRLSENDENYNRYDYALVDGKQRLETIWEFFDGGFALADDFEFKKRIKDAERKSHGVIEKGWRFRDLNNHWQEKFKNIVLDVVVIEDADEQDIEELFSRLNHAEPLNAAEKRNAFGGDMNKVIREIAKSNKFFTQVLPFENKRYVHYDIVARFLLIEDKVLGGGEPYCDLKKRFLDNLVKENKKMDDAKRDGLEKLVKAQTNSMTRVFEKKDVLLRKTGASQLYYLFLKEEEQKYVFDVSLIKKFLIDFNVERAESLEEPPENKEGERYRILDEFEINMQQGNDKNSLKKRVDILIRFFVEDYYEQIKVKDIQRFFTEGVRHILYYKSGRKCAKCGKEFKTFADFDADHVIAWSKGGETTLANARALCQSCNRASGAN